MPDAGGAAIIISWRTSDPNGAEVRVLTAGHPEKLVSRGQSGEVEIPWINNSTEYDFRLYGATRPKALLDSVKFKPNEDSVDGILPRLANAVRRGKIDIAELSQFIADAVPHCVNSPQFQNIFRQWERHGFHVTPVHFYQPIPDTRALSEKLWNQPSELAGIDMNESAQLDLLRNVFPRFRDEYEQFSSEPTGEAGRFHFNNGFFDGTDALVAYRMLRHFQPRLIIEVGSGFSSLITAEAVARGNQSELICIEPFPRDFLRAGFPGLKALIEKKVQDVDLDFFSELNSGDILFIDSSHTVKIGGDVNYLFSKCCRV